MRNVVCAEQRNDDVEDVKRNERENGGGGCGEHAALKAEERPLASTERRTCVAALARRLRVQRAIVPAAAERILYYKPPQRRVPLTPGEVEFSVE